MAKTIDRPNKFSVSKNKISISSATLHIVAMISMLIDHTLRTVVENDTGVAILGRLAFPIFAFMAAEGCFYTHNFRKYSLRLLVFAILSEVPYDLMKSGMIFDRYDQNVIWTFLIAVLCIRATQIAKEKGNAVYAVTTAAVVFAGFVLGMILSVDYGGMGVITVMIFYFFRERNPRNMAVQFVLLLIVNAVFLGGFGYAVSLSFVGQEVEIPVQGFAIFAFIPLWLYHGRQGYHSKPFQYFCYAFYPVHMALLYVISRII